MSSRSPMGLLVVAAALWSGCGDEGFSGDGPTDEVQVQDAVWRDGPSTASRDRLPCTSAHEPANFTYYTLGARFEDLPLTSVGRTCARPFAGEWGRANYVSLIYGTCEAPRSGGYADGGCAPPLEIQTWPACERSLADLGREGPEPDERERLSELRGVPAQRSSDRIEIYTGASTIVIHGRSELTARAAAAVSAAAGGAAPEDAAVAPEASEGGDLPTPEPGALRGALSCSG